MWYEETDAMDAYTAWYVHFFYTDFLIYTRGTENVVNSILRGPNYLFLFQEGVSRYDLSISVQVITTHVL